jgi:Barstar (barnase inhibitor)
MTRRASTVVIVDVPTSKIHDWKSFHDVFAAALGFAGYYGRNLDAFLDILEAPQAPDVGADVPEGGVLVLRLDEAGEDFRSRSPEQYDFLVETAASLSDGAARIGEPGFLGNAFVALAFRFS